MSTATARDTAIHNVDREFARMHTAAAAHVPEKRSALSRLFTWYRQAVVSPATEKEREDWQKHSF